jgi:hypothetical protein
VSRSRLEVAAVAVASVPVEFRAVGQRLQHLTERAVSDHLVAVVRTRRVSQGRADVIHPLLALVAASAQLERDRVIKNVRPELEGTGLSRREPSKVEFRRPRSVVFVRVVLGHERAIDLAAVVVGQREVAGSMVFGGERFARVEGIGRVCPRRRTLVLAAAVVRRPVRIVERTVGAASASSRDAGRGRAGSQPADRPPSAAVSSYQSVLQALVQSRDFRSSLLVCANRYRANALGAGFVRIHSRTELDRGPGSVTHLCRRPDRSDTDRSGPDRKNSVRREDIR